MAESGFWPVAVNDVMFQKEVAERILAEPASKTYGRLSVIAQAASMQPRGYDLPARAFTPPPKVDSTVVTFTPRPIDGDVLLNLKSLRRPRSANGGKWCAHH